MKDSLFACVLAGGSGERFWPLSRVSRPKHLSTILSEETLLAATVRRLERVLPPAQIFVLTHASQVEACQAVLPQLAPEQFVVEPAKRDTAAACALGIAVVRRRDPNAVVIFLPADALIQDEATFAAQMEIVSAQARAVPGFITFGMRPTFACTRFGYLEAGAAAAASQPDCPIYEVKRFVEKPDAVRAEIYLQSGRFFWNVGILICQVQSFVREAERLAPDLARFLADFPAADERGYLELIFPQLRKISIDYALLEQAASVRVAEARFDWDDVGSWSALPAHLPPDAQGNHVLGAAAIHESSRNLVISTGRTIALCGVSDLVVVETADAVLVCHRNAAEAVKHLQAHLPPELR